MAKKIILLGNDLPEKMMDSHDFERKNVSQLIHQLNTQALWMIVVCDEDHPLVKNTESNEVDIEEAYVLAYSDLPCITNVGSSTLLVNLPDFVSETIESGSLFVKTSKGFTSIRRISEYGEDAERIYDILSLLLEGE